MTDERKGIIWWKVRVQKLKGLLRSMETGICSMYRKEEELWHILECKGMNEWMEKVLGKRFWKLDPVIGIHKIALCRSRENLHKIGPYIRQYMENGTGILKKYQAESM
jgi:hypothetical protein